MHRSLCCISTPLSVNVFVLCIFHVFLALCVLKVLLSRVCGCLPVSCGRYSFSKAEANRGSGKGECGASGPVWIHTRSGSPFYCRVCFPGYCPPRARWRRIALEEPVLLLYSPWAGPCWRLRGAQSLRLHFSGTTLETGSKYVEHIA